MCGNDCNKMKKKIISQSNSKIQSRNCRNREITSIPLVDDYTMSWCGRAITIGGFMGLPPPLPPPTEMMRSCKCFPNVSKMSTFTDM